MSIGEVQMRIATIQTQVAALRSTAAGAAGAAGTIARPGSAAATSAASGAQFAAALSGAVAAQSSAHTAATSHGHATGLQPATVGGWVKPVEGRISSHFGHREGGHHAGLDIAAKTGTPVHAPSDGVIRKASWYGGYGNAVIIDHGNGTQTLYGHNSALTVTEGQQVKAGDVIAKVGSTGDSSGPHVHMEVKVDGKKVDPEPWLKSRGVTW